MIPPSSPIENISSPYDSDLSLEHDSLSEDDTTPRADSEAQDAAPELRQAEEDDDMQVDGAPEYKSRRSLKRKLNDSFDPGQSENAATTAEPQLKRRRTGIESEETTPPILQDFHHANDSDFIELICKHGGRMVDAQGKIIRLEVPAAGSLEFRVTMICMKLERMVQNIDFPGKEEFVPHAFAEFVGRLEEASYANEAALVRRLLATGMGKTAGEVLEQILNEARARGASDAVICLRAACPQAIAFPATPAASTPAPASVARIALPPPEGWHFMLRPSFSDRELLSIAKTLAMGGDSEKVVTMLFGGTCKRPAGTFFAHILYDLPQSIRNILTKCGAVLSSNQEVSVTLHCADFNHAQLKRKLAEMQARENDNGFTALMFAVQWGDPELVSHLLSERANREDYDRALILAIRTRNGDIARLLLERQPNIDIHATDRNNKRAMTYAAATGDIALCELLRQHGALIQPEIMEDEEGNRRKSVAPLVAAAQSGMSDACIWLIGQSANIETSWNYHSPLLEAALNGHLDTCKTLIALGARLDVSPKAQYSLLSAAAHGGNKALFQYFLEKGVREDAQKPRTSLLAAAENGQTEMLRFLLDTGGDINGKNKKGESALRLAFQSGELNAIELLLESGATCVEDELVVSAAASGSPRVLDWIISRREVTPPLLLFKALHAAAAYSSLDCVWRLIELKAPADPTDVGLMSASNPLLALKFKDWKNPEILNKVTLLISHGAPLHHTDCNGRDPLILAAASGNGSAVAVLLSSGARIGQSVGWTGANALQIAIMELEAMLNAPDSYSVGQVENMGLVVLALLNAMDAQENRSQLAKDAVNRTKHRAVQDMILGARPADRRPIPQPSADLLLSLLDERSQPFQNLTLFLQKHQDLLLSPKTDPSLDDTLRKHLLHHGFMHSLIDLLLPFLKALPAMAPALLGKQDKNAGVDFTAFCFGVLSAVSQRVRAPGGFTDPYAGLHIEFSVKNALQTFHRRILSKLLGDADHFESRSLSECFSNLFENCLETTMQGREASHPMSEIQPQPGKIAEALVKKFVYARLAESIEAAWMSAWKTIASAQADGKANFWKIPSADHMRASEGLEDADILAELWNSENQPWVKTDGDVHYTAMSVIPTQTFAETTACKDLLAEFRRELKHLIDTPGTDILRLPGASAEEEASYSELMFRQLHMLAQFIKAEPEARAAPSSSASSSSMSAAPSM